MSKTSMATATAIGVVVLVLLFLITPSTAEIKTVTITSDTRPMILFEKFGFTETGHVEILVSSLSVVAPESVQLNPRHQGFFLLNEGSLFQVIEEIQQNPTFCVLDSHYITLLTFHNLSHLSSFNLSYSVTSPNVYSLFFTNCVPDSSISMHLRTEFFNLDRNGFRNYLSVGQTHLPSLFFLFFVAYFVFLLFWLYLCHVRKCSIRFLHLLMASLLLAKALNLLCAFEVNHFVKVIGTPRGWDVLFYVFQFIRVVLFFTVIVLVLKGKKVMMIVIPLIQVVANVAYVVIGINGPFMENWVTWNQLSLLLEFITWCIVLLLIILSLRSLRRISKTPGNLDKLTLVKRFCILVIGYLFFTHFLVFVLRTVVDYKYRWASNLAEESFSLVFYIVMFYMFRPVKKEEYSVIDEEEEDVAKIAVKG